MIPVLVIVVVALLVAVFSVVRARRSAADSDPAGARPARRSAPAAPPPVARLDDEELRARVAAELRQKGKIQAIKLLREQRPMGLKEAKDAVERLEAGTGFTVIDFDESDAARHPGTGLESRLSPEALARVRDLKRGGKVIQAIKLTREQTGLGLKEAKDLVDGL
jgi:ribosomal protein L7/L12